MIADTGPGSTMLRILTDEEAVNYIALARQTGTILSWTERESLPVHFEPHTCVSMVRTIIGFPGWAWTPYQLYRKLKKAGATERKPPA